MVFTEKGGRAPERAHFGSTTIILMVQLQVRGLLRTMYRLSLEISYLTLAMI
jgi:hypothetical protein